MVAVALGHLLRRPASGDEDACAYRAAPRRLGHDRRRGGQRRQVARAGTATPVAPAVAAAIALAGGLAANRVRREGWAFIGTATAIALAVATLFAALFPEVLPSTTPRPPHTP